ncbi:hypothetical protein BHM03_00033517 [Ensete ventricosum]|nr:hypothetical protein BHM03_00033517 [Ensete ventricosum]
MDHEKSPEPTMVDCLLIEARRAQRKEHRGIVSSPLRDSHQSKSRRVKVRSEQKRTCRRKGKKETLLEGGRGGVVSTEGASSSRSMAPMEKNFLILSRALISPMDRMGKTLSTMCTAYTTGKP